MREPDKDADRDENTDVKKDKMGPGKAAIPGWSMGKQVQTAAPEQDCKAQVERQGNLSFLPSLGSSPVLAI